LAAPLAIFSYFAIAVFAVPMTTLRFIRAQQELIAYNSVQIASLDRDSPPWSAHCIEVRIIGTRPGEKILRAIGAKGEKLHELTGLAYGTNNPHELQRDLEENGNGKVIGTIVYGPKVPDWGLDQNRGLFRSYQNGEWKVPE
jgi:hypothetical protein